MKSPEMREDTKTNEESGIEDDGRGKAEKILGDFASG
jgi:hypothetical protein